MRIPLLPLVIAASISAPLAACHASELHVAINGNDSHRGTRGAPLRTIQRAADLAQPGDVITVHAGVYRERVSPPRGGTSDRKRIVYRAAPDEKVEIKGSEVIRTWEKVQGDVWKVTLPNSFFGRFNPYADLIHGDWFDGRGRDHHTGAVYLNGTWLIEAAKLDEVLHPTGTAPAWMSQGGDEYLLNVAWVSCFRPKPPVFRRFGVASGRRAAALPPSHSHSCAHLAIERPPMNGDVRRHANRQQRYDDRFRTAGPTLQTSLFRPAPKVVAAIGPGISAEQ